MANLIIRSGKHKGRKIVVPMKEIVVGRDEGCYIRLFSTDISRKHCTLTATPEGILVKDLGSSNGTLVNDIPVRGEQVLNPGDVLRIGPAEFEVPGAKPQLAKFDDEIAEWLAEGDTARAGVRAGDTTIVKKTSEITAVQAAEAAKPSTDSSIGDMNSVLARKTPLPSRREFRTTADEAQDIIRRHKEWLASQE